MSFRRISRKSLLFLSFFGVVLFLLLAQNIVFQESESTPLPLSLFEFKNKPCFDFDLPDSNLSREIYLNLKSAIAIDNNTHEVLYSYNADRIRPIASISKLLTAMVILDNYKPDSVMIITRQDAYRSSRSIFRVGDQVKVKDLLHSALLNSDNRAARALVRSVSSCNEDFTALMNSKAKYLGLSSTETVEPTGLDERNLSTAADCAKLVNLAMMCPEIAKITSLKKYEFKLVNRNKAKRLINTNKMVFSKYKVLAGKTGYTIKSDYCLATVLENSEGEQATIIVLGVPGPQRRFREARRLANLAFKKIHTKDMSNL